MTVSRIVAVRAVVMTRPTPALDSSARRHYQMEKQMKITEIAFTSYPVTDLKRARQFYEGVLDLKEA